MRSLLYGQYNLFRPLLLLYTFLVFSFLLLQSAASPDSSLIQENQRLVHSIEALTENPSFQNEDSSLSAQNSNVLGSKYLAARQAELTTTSGQTTTLATSGDFTCGPGRPCGNGACCGESGWCGYEAKYCGTGCQSNCGAKAECGTYAAIPGTGCPLNVCCSKFGTLIAVPHVACFCKKRVPPKLWFNINDLY
jgi:hypothetical protein